MANQSMWNAIWSGLITRVATPHRYRVRQSRHPVRHQAISDFAGFSRIRAATDIIRYGFTMDAEFSDTDRAGLLMRQPYARTSPQIATGTSGRRSTG